MTEHDTEYDIASLLRETPVPPSRVTTDQAIALGRRATRRRRHGITAAAAAAVVAVTVGGFTLAQPTRNPTPLTLASPSPSVSLRPVDYSRWSVEVLPLPEGIRNVKVVAMDTSGRYLLGMTDAYRALVWENLTPRIVPLTPGLNDQVIPVDVNASGIAIGNGTKGGNAWMYRDGVTTKLTSPGSGGHYQVRDINDRGDILGWSQLSGTIVWSADSPSAVPRVVPGVDEPFSIGEDGSVGGSIRTPTRPVVVSPDGEARPLAETPGKPGGNVFHLSGDWACGWVATTNGPGTEMLARWRLSTGELTSWPSTETNCTGMSQTGALLSASDPSKHSLFVAPDGTLIAMPVDAKPQDADLRAISSDASVIGGNLTVGSDDRVFTGAVWRRTG